MNANSLLRKIRGVAATVIVLAAPAVFAEDAYIESDGTQFINTGYRPNGKTKVEVDFQMTSTASSKDCVFGNYGDPKFSVLLYANPSSGGGRFQFCGKDGGWSGVSTGVAIDTARHTMVIDVPKKKGTMFAADGTVQGTADFGSWTYANTADWPLAFFASCNNASGTSARQFVSAKIYGAKIWESDDGESYKLVHDYSPAIKAGIAGFLDSVTGTFLYDTRTSGLAFASGGDIATIDDDPYVESDGTGAINTGVFASPDLKIDIDYAFTDVADPTPSGTIHYQQRLFGQDTVSPTVAIYINGSQNVSMAAGDSFAAASTGIKADLKRHTAIIDCTAKTHALMTGVTTNWNNTTACSNMTKSAARPLALFGDTTNNGGTSFYNYSKAKVYGLRIWMGGTLVRDFAPRCIDGVAGFEDRVTGKFYTCAGLTASENAPTALFGRSGEGDGFIESDGSLYSSVDTRYFPSYKTKVEVDFQMVKVESGTVPFGEYGSSGFTMFLFCNTETTPKFRPQAQDGSYQSALATPSMKVDVSRHTLVMDVPKRNISISAPDGSVEVSGTMPDSVSYTGTSAWPFTLFASATSAYGKTQKNAKVRIFSVKISESNDGENYTNVHTFMPCVKGGVPGFKDEKTGAFFSGDGLIAGGNVSEEDDDSYVENATTGKCWFDTGLKVTDKTKIVCDFVPLTSTPQMFPFEAGDSTSAANGSMFMRAYGNGSTNYAYACGNQLWKGSGVWFSPYVRRKLTLDAKNKVFVIASTYGHTVQEMTIAEFDNPNESSTTLKVFANGAGNGGNAMCGRLYRFQVYENETLIRDYVPICQAGKYALRDKVTGAVLTKASSSAEFTGFTENTALNDAFFNAPMRAEDAYIESDGTQGINLNYFTTPNTRYEIDYQMTEIVGQNRPFGEAAGTLSAELYIQGNATGSGNVAFGVGNTWKGQYTNMGADLNRHLAVLDLANQDCAYSGKGWLAFSSDTVCTKTATAPMWLFARGTSAGGGYDSRTKMKLYAFRIFESGMLVHEYLPYKNGDVVGLYDTMTDDVITSTVSGSNAFTLGGGLGYGKFAGDKKVLVVAPSATTIQAGKSNTLKAFAPGAVRYVWTRNGEEVAGVTGAECTVTWERPSKVGVLTYGVTPVFSIAGEDVLGTKATAEVTMNPLGMIVIIR